MNKIILFVLLITLITPTEYKSPQSVTPVIVIEDGTYMGGQLPQFGEICIATEVRGGPEEFYPILYSLEVGQITPLHELSRPTGEWVMIAPAEWIPLSAVCKW